MLTWLNDEVLSAYIDGELPAAEAARVALALTRDADAVRRLNALRQSDAILKEAFDWPLPGQADLTEHLGERMESASPFSRPGPRLALLAACVVAAASVGLAAGQFSAPRDVRLDPNRGAIAGASLARALENQASDAAGPLRIAFTFRAADGRFCRQFTTDSGLVGVACRDGRDWRLPVLLTPGSQAAAYDAAAAGGGDGPVDRAVAAIGVTEVLDLAQEGRLIRSGWRSSGDRQAGPRLAAATPPA